MANLFPPPVGVAISFAIFQAKIVEKLPTSIITYALQAGVTPDLLPALVGTVAMANGAPIAGLPGVTDAQIAAAEQGRKVVGHSHLPFDHGIKTILHRPLPNPSPSYGTHCYPGLP